MVRGKIFGDGGCGGDCKLLSVGMRGGLGGWDVERTRGLGGLTGQGEERTGYERNAGQETRSRNDGRRQKKKGTSKQDNNMKYRVIEIV